MKVARPATTTSSSTCSSATRTTTSCSSRAKAASTHNAFSTFQKAPAPPAAGASPNCSTSRKAKPSPASWPSKIWRRQRHSWSLRRSRAPSNGRRLQRFGGAFRTNGIIAIGLADDDKLIGVDAVESGETVMLATQKGQAVRFWIDGHPHHKEGNAGGVRPMGRPAAGVGEVRLKAQG